MISLASNVTQNLTESTRREWLVTNGLGGFACGTVSGITTRRYHGLLVAALYPPRGRHVLVTHLDEVLTFRHARTPLAAHAFPGAVSPDGYKSIASFELDPLPLWRYRVGEVELERAVFMVRGQNTTVVRYTLTRAPGAVTLTVQPFGAFRDFHSHAHANGDASLAAKTDPERPDTIVMKPYAGLTGVRVSATGVFSAAPDWWKNFEHAVEIERGLDGYEDLFTPGSFLLALAPGESAYVVIQTEAEPALTEAMCRAHEEDEIRRLRALEPRGETDARVGALHVAVDSYRADLARPPALLAGYPWFEDWGRDTLIAFTGAYLVTERFAEGRDLLAAFAKYVDQGMVPNRFPDGAAGHADYNTVDAPMWFFHAARRYLQYTGDEAFGRDALLPALAEIERWYRRGTRYNIRVEDDGLVYAGDGGTQLTWMDAKVGDWVVTSRHGAPVEINALWHAALRTLAWMHGRYGDPGESARCTAEADRVRESFRAKFWNRARAYLFDVVRPDWSDPAVRPNALLAVALPGDLIAPEQQMQVLARAKRDLLVPFALRSLAPDDPAYQGRFTGDPHARDGAYHQGTAWPFLLGWYTSALARHDPSARDEVLGLFDGLTEALAAHGLGHIAEVMEGDAPHRSVGCFAQAWSDCELLRALVEDGLGRGPRDEL